MDWPFIAEALPVLISAAGTTIAVSAAGIVLGLLVGAPVAFAALSRHGAARGFAAVYVSFFRGVPLLVQLLLAYYALPFLGLDVPALGAAIGMMGLCSAAYVAEIIRGGLVLVPPGGIEAARLLGLSPTQIGLRIKLPIAVRAMLPALANEAILLLKASSLISVVGILELTRASQALASSTFRPLEAYALCGAIYLVINLALAAAFGLGRARA